MVFGERLKALRRNAGYTQQNMADMLGTTCQAVSRWETNVSMPDISMIPTLCSLLEVSADKLLGIDEENREKEIARVLEQNGGIELSADRGVIAGAVEDLRRAVRDYPGDMRLMRLLKEMIAGLEEFAIDDADKTEYNALLNEHAALIDALMRREEDTDSRLSATAEKCFLLRDLGRDAEAAALAQTLPSNRNTREGVLRSILTGEAQAALCSAGVFDGYLELTLSLMRLVDCVDAGGHALLDDADALCLIEAFARADKALWGEGGAYAFFTGLLFLRAAVICVKKGDNTAALGYCERAASVCTAKDDAQMLHMNALLGKKRDASGCAQALCAKLESDSFAPLGSEPRFVALRARLELAARDE